MQRGRGDGRLLIHGAPCIAQQHAAKVFNAIKTYFVLNGTLTHSNKVVLNALVTPERSGSVDVTTTNQLRRIVQAGATPVVWKPRVTRMWFYRRDRRSLLRRRLRELISENAPQRPRSTSIPSGRHPVGTTTVPFITPVRSSIKIGHLCDYICLTPLGSAMNQFIPMMTDCSPLLCWN